MDAMTAFSSIVVTQKGRLRAHWPALLLPLVALGTVGLLGKPIPQILVILAVLLALAVPAEGAKVVHFALFAYGAYGLFKLHSLQIYESQGVRYGLVTASRGTITIPGGYQLTSQTSGFAPMLAEAVGCIALGVCVLGVTCAPGGRAVRRAVSQLHGGDGQQKIVPPLLLIPVMLLWEELFSEHLWFAGSGAPGVLAVVAFAVGVALIVRLPRVAAVTAVAGTVILGLYGVSWGLHWLTTGGSAYRDAVDSPQFGAVLLDGGTSELLAGLQGLALCGFGGFLVLRLLSWDTDAALAARAQELTQRVTRLAETRSDATDTAVAELRRIERDLHDGAQARFVAVGMSLRAAEQLLATNPEAAMALVAEARETSTRALDDLRNLVRGIYPPVLADRGLADAVRALALDAPLDVDTDITLTDEPPMPVAAAVYFAVAEALTNAVRHSGADTVQIEIGYADGTIRATIIDDGQGGADQAAGTGLSGVERRLAAFDGILAVSSPPGGPTIVAIEVPCALSDNSWIGPDRSWADVVRSSWRTRTLI
jgi:signal transduction histidine kinase